MPPSRARRRHIHSIRRASIDRSPNRIARWAARFSRVEVWRGGVGQAYLWSDPFGCRCLTSMPLLRFHTPLIEPDVRFSRIRLSDKDSRVRPREAASSLLEGHKPHPLVQVNVGVA